MKIIIEDKTDSAKLLYYQSLVLLYLPCERFGENDGGDGFLHVKAWTEDNFNCVDIKFSVYGRSCECADKKEINRRQYADMKNFISRTFLKCAEKLFGFLPPWGISTGVKPVKLAGMYVEGFGKNEAFRILTEEYMIKPLKARTAIEAWLNEKRIVSSFDEKPCSIYVSIPFCPSRCGYCSFVSTSTPKLLSLIPSYIEKLKSEILAVSEIVSEKGLNVQSVYFGGGTPAILDERQIFELVSHVKNLFDTENAEFTFEAGRPDCITYEKLAVLKNLGVERVSINTQTSNDDVLASLGRRHTFKMYCEAMEAAKKIGFECINTDLIAGLPGESVASFKNSLTSVASLEPQNITVHAFTLKKASDIRTAGKTGFDGDTDASEMTDFACEYLTETGYKPYYLYRQKNTVGNLDNVGYATAGNESVYNIVMMGEKHTVFGVGAGAVTKIVSEENGVERIFSPKYPYEFLDENKYSGFDVKRCKALIEKGEKLEQK